MPTSAFLLRVLANVSVICHCHFKFGWNSQVDLRVIRIWLSRMNQDGKRRNREGSTKMDWHVEQIFTRYSAFYISLLYVQSVCWLDRSVSGLCSMGCLYTVHSNKSSVAYSRCWYERTISKTNSVNPVPDDPCPL